MRIKVMKTLLSSILLTFLVLFGSGHALAQFSDTHEMLKGVEDKDMAQVRKYMFKGANINGLKEGRPGILIALENRDYPMMRLLLENGALPNIKNIPDEETTLMVAAAKGDEEAIRLLAEFGADINMSDRQGRTALMKAASNRKKDAVEALLELGADPYQSDYTGRDALQYAQEARARAVIRILEGAGQN